MTPPSEISGVLVGGKKPGEIYDAAVEKTRRERDAEEARRIDQERSLHRDDGLTERIQEKTKGLATGQKSASAPTPFRTLAIEERPDHYLVQGFQFRGLEHALHVAKNPIEPPSRTQHHYFERLTRNILTTANDDEDGAPAFEPGFYIGTAPFYVQLFYQLGVMHDYLDALHQKRGITPIQCMMREDLSGLRGSLQKTLSSNPCHTLTSVLYSRSSGDTVIHEIGTTGESRCPAEIQGVHIELSRLIPSRARPVCRWLFQTGLVEPTIAATWLSDQSIGGAGTFYIGAIGGLVKVDEYQVPLTMRLVEKNQLAMNLDEAIIGNGIGVRIWNHDRRMVLL